MHTKEKMHTARKIIKKLNKTKTDTEENQMFTNKVTYSNRGTDSYLYMEFKYPCSTYIGYKM